jgi:serine phosphatase RsbU (regulator of sigma subunit)
VGSGKLNSTEKIKIHTIAEPGQKIYVASDGLYEQTGGPGSLPMGYEPISKIMLAHHNEPQEIIAEKIWEAFEKYRGDSLRCDDVLLIGLTPKGGSLK